MNVVVGYKEAAQDRGAVEHAVAECARGGGELHIVNYVDFDAVHPQSVDAATTRVKALRQEVEELAEEIRTRGVGCTVHAVDEPGRHAADVVLDVAEDVEAARVVIAMRQRTRVGKALLGSTAQDVLLRSPAPVLAVPVG